MRVDDTISADQALRLIHRGITLRWKGDYHNARQLLGALGRRLPPRRGEHLGLRQRDDLLEMFHVGGLTVTGRVDTAARHRRARPQEVTSLWRLRP